jgi:CHAT domain-containing protein/tetratricopeptide (TPR) repeat protein
MPRRPDVVRTAVVVAIAATALLVAWLLAVARPWREPPPFEQLVASLAGEPARPVAGRLTGGFGYAPPPVPMRSAAARTSSPDTRIAAARIEKAALESPTASNQAHLGSAFVVVGEWDKAVAALEDAVERDAGRATFQTDLAAAYLARAEALGQGEDWARALASATRAIALDAGRAEAHFNRALALRGLHLPVEERGAWSAYASVDPAGPWRAEAARYEEALGRREPRTDEAGDSTRDSQQRRERLEDDLLSRWGAAVSGGDAAAGELLRVAEQEAAALVAAGGDTMASDEVKLIRRLERGGHRSRLRRVAAGHALYGQARQVFLQSDRDSAAALMEKAAAHFASVHSPYRHWAAIYRAFALRFQAKARVALEVLKTVPVGSLPRTYHHLRGRHAWAEGVMWGAAGRYDLEREPMARAIEEFRVAGEKDYHIATVTLLAESEWFLGDHRAAWSHILTALELGAGNQHATRDYHLLIGSIMAKGFGLPEVALELLNARARVARTPGATGETFLYRSRLLTTLGRRAESASDLAAAAKAAALLPTGGFRNRLSTDIEISRAEWFSRTDCRQAIAHADAVHSVVASVRHSMRTVGLLAIRARCRAQLGDLSGARADLLEAVAVFEQRRGEFASPADRIQAFEEERDSFKALTLLEVTSFGDDIAGLHMAERGREGVLPRPRTAADGGADYRRLPRGVAVVYYETFDDRVLTWVLTREGHTLLTHPTGVAALKRMVADIQRQIGRGVDVASLRPHAQRLYATLIAPALGFIDGQSTSEERPAVFFVPDGPLFAVPFGALPDDDGRPLISTRTVGVAPSLAAFLQASARLATFAPRDVLAVGDGHDVAASGLPRLSNADAEAAAVGRRYRTGVVLTGSAATKDRVLRGRASVLHFAGHTVVNPQYPMHSRMLLAPNPATGDRGWLLGSEINPAAFGSTGVVILATCDGAAGRLVEGEGAISIARSFFTAGVPAVVASLWPVADDLPEFAETLHRELAAGRDAARALRAAQLAILQSRGPNAPVRLWGGFIMFGGLGTAL